MSVHDKPIYASMPNEEYSGMLVSPIKPGTRIKVETESYLFTRAPYNTTNWIHGTLEYRDWLGKGTSSPYHWDAGIRYGPLHDDWRVILRDTIWELDE